MSSRVPQRGVRQKEPRDRREPPRVQISERSREVLNELMRGAVVPQWLVIERALEAYLEGGGRTDG